MHNHSIAINEMRRGQNALGNICTYNIVEDGLVNVKVKAFKKNEVTGDYKPRNFKFYAPNQNSKLCCMEHSPVLKGAKCWFQINVVGYNGRNKCVVSNTQYNKNGSNVA